MPPTPPPQDWLAIIWSILSQHIKGRGDPLTPASLATQLSVWSVSEAEALAGLNQLAESGLLVENDGVWDFTDAGREMMGDPAGGL